MISIPIPFLSADIDDLMVLFTIPLIIDVLPSGKNIWISMAVPEANPFCVLINKPFSERSLDMPVKNLLSELNLTSSLLIPL
jgi:hypothetical protein